jgi:hypothetical protein
MTPTKILLLLSKIDMPLLIPFPFGTMINYRCMTHVGGVSEKPDGIPEHERDRTVNTFRDSDDAKGD